MKRTSDQFNGGPQIKREFQTENINYELVWKDKYESTEKKLEEVRQRLKESKELTKVFKSKFEESHNTTSLYINENKKLQGKLTKHAQKHDNSQDSTDDVICTDDNNNQIVSRLKKEIDQLKQDFNQLKSNNEKLKLENASKNEIITKLIHSDKEFRKQRTISTKSLATLKAMNAKLSSETEKIKTEFNTIMKELRIAKSENLEAILQRDREANRNEKITKDLENIRSRIRDFTQSSKNIEKEWQHRVNDVNLVIQLIKESSRAHEHTDAGESFKHYATYFKTELYFWSQRWDEAIIQRDRLAEFTTTK